MFLPFLTNCHLSRKVLLIMTTTSSDLPQVLNSFPAETLGALRAMNRAFARVVVENHQLGLPMIQFIDGELVETSAESLLPQAHRFLETNGELLPRQTGH